MGGGGRGLGLGTLEGQEEHKKPSVAPRIFPPLDRWIYAGIV